MSTTTVRTQRLRGRPMVAADAPLLAELLTDRRVAATLGGVPTQADLDATVARQAAHWTAHGFGYWLWFDAATDAVIGRGGLSLVIVEGQAAVEVGWAVDAERWGEGLGSELGAFAVGHAFDVLGLDELVAYTLPANFASRRIMEKLDFHRQGGTFLHEGLAHVLYRRRAAPPGDPRELA